MGASSRNSGKTLVKKAELAVFRKMLVKTAKEEGEKLRRKQAEDRKYRTWKYLAERVRELKK